jgi:Acetyltransferase (GNAT) domain
LSVQIDLLTGDQEANYEKFLQSIDSSLLYASLPYRDFLRCILTESQDRYLVAYKSGEIIGALPLFVKRNVKLGNLLNSLPFYGSNGGVITPPGAPEALAVKRALIQSFYELASEESAVAATLISNPLDAESAFYEANIEYSLRDERIGQLTPLPAQSDEALELQEALMALFHQKTRNCVRKAQRSKIGLRHSDSIEDLRALFLLHSQNMVAINATPKPWSIFTTIRETFVYDRDYRIYVAEKDQQVIAALLIFFYNRTAEYFTPATLEPYRVLQPMSLLIFEAMQEAVRRGLTNWNWGGTWLTQGGVYHFKKRWGTVDRRYFYYTRVFDDSIMKCSKELLLQEYPYYFVVPFGSLKNEEL